MADFDFIAPPKTVTVTISLEPAYNAIVSLSSLGMVDKFSGLSEWIYQTARSLSPEQLHTNQLALIDAYAHLGDAGWPSFPAWVEDLAAREPTMMRDQALQAQLTKVGKAVDGEIPEPSELLADRAAYLALIEAGYFPRRKTRDLSIWEELHRLLNDPPALQGLIVTHLSTMWDEILAPEWERNLPLLQESVAAFQALDWTGLTAVEALTRVSLRETPPPIAQGSYLTRIDHLILFPSAHTGPYLVHLSGLSASTARFAFGAHVPAGVPVRSHAVSRSELLMRLNALANDTRLRILELLAQERELNTPDIMARLELSQSAAARHLEHLAATGFLTVRRHEGANVYELNPDRMDHTVQALQSFAGMR